MPTTTETQAVQDLQDMAGEPKITKTQAVHEYAWKLASYDEDAAEAIIELWEALPVGDPTKMRFVETAMGQADLDA